jgi:hypothetical protein
VQLALGHARESVAPLERALALRESKPGARVQTAETGFWLGRAVWQVGDHHRALELAHAARAAYAAAGATGKKGTAEVDAWLAKHEAPVGSAP